MDFGRERLLHDPHRPDSWSDDVLVSDGFAGNADIDAAICAFRAAIEATSNGEHRAQARLLPSRAEVSLRAAATLCDRAIAERLRNLRDRTVTTIKESFQVPAELPEFSLMAEMRTGDCHPLHADGEVQTPEGWRPNHTAWRTRVGLIYLNTCGIDYHGGLLRLPELGRTISPRAGMLMAFPAGRRHVHEVTTIEAGVRLSLAIWLTADPARAERWEAAEV